MILNIFLIILIITAFNTHELGSYKNIISTDFPNKTYKYTDNSYKYNFKNKNSDYKELKIYGPFSVEDKTIAAELLSKILCNNSSKKSIRNLFETEADKNNLPEGIIYSYEVIKAGNRLRDNLDMNCDLNLIKESIKQKIFNDSFKVNK